MDFWGLKRLSKQEKFITLKNIRQNTMLAYKNKYFEHLFNKKEKMEILNFNFHVNQFGDEGCKY